MVTPFSSTVSSGQRGSALPPWLWFWLALYLRGFSETFDRLKVTALILFTGNDGTNSISYTILERVPVIVELLLRLTLPIGILAVFLPWIRTLFLERKYGLTEPRSLPPGTAPETLWTLDQVSGFVRGHAPELLLTYNARGKLLSDKAFVYPIGYRRAGLALSGTLLALWNSDQQAAQAILLHEIEHYRHGDMLVIGAGSLLQTIIRRWFLLTLVFYGISLILGLLIEHFTSFQEDMSVTSDLSTVIAFHIQQFFVTDIPSMILFFFQSFFLAGSLITLIITAIWCTEINADRFVIDTTQSTTALVAAMRQHAAAASRRSWLLSGIYHPPTALRRWLVSHSENTSGLTRLLLLFPLGWFIGLCFLCGQLLVVYLSFALGGRISGGDIVSALTANVQSFFEALVPAWICMALLIALWPVLRRYWERLFAREQVRKAGTNYSAYGFSTAFVLLVCCLGLVLSWLPAPLASTKSDHPSPSDHLQVGATATIDGIWTVTVLDAQEKQSDGLLPAKLGRAYLAIDVSLKNISSQTNQLASAFQFHLRDVHGNQYDETYIAATPPPATAQDGNVAAGATAQGQLNYDVPVSVSQYILSFEADWKNPDPSKTINWDITSGSATVPAGTPKPVPTSSGTSGYPLLQQSYRGTLVNTANNSRTNANATLSSVVQVEKTIAGNMTIQLPLAGSGPFTGTVASNGALQFTVIPTDNSGYIEIVFTGTVHADGSMSGIYTLPENGQGGTWQFHPA